MNTNTVLEKMIEFDAGDPKRIQHFVKVYTFASAIGKGEGLAPRQQEILEIAAILHDIGIHASEEKYGSPAGKYQEIEGPALARNLLQPLGYDEALIERVAYLIGHHHTYDQVDGIDYRILLEADFLVNSYEDDLSEKAILAFKEKVFETATGKKMLDDMFGLNR